MLLARAVEGFVSDCEKVCGRQSLNLRGTLLSQAKRFVEKFHEERKQKLGYGILYDPNLSRVQSSIDKLMNASIYSYIHSQYI